MGRRGLGQEVVQWGRIGPGSQRPDGRPPRVGIARLQRGTNGLAGLGTAQRPEHRDQRGFALSAGLLQCLKQRIDRLCIAIDRNQGRFHGGAIGRSVQEFDDLQTGFASARVPRARIASPRTPASWLSADVNKAGTASLADRATKTRMIFRWAGPDDCFRPVTRAASTPGPRSRTRPSSTCLTTSLSPECKPSSSRGTLVTLPTLPSAANAAWRTAGSLLAAARRDDWQRGRLAPIRQGLDHAQLNCKRKTGVFVGKLLQKVFARTEVQRSNCGGLQDRILAGQGIDQRTGSLVAQQLQTSQQCRGTDASRSIGSLQRLQGRQGIFGLALGLKILGNEQNHLKPLWPQFGRDFRCEKGENLMSLIVADLAEGMERRGGDDVIGVAAMPLSNQGHGLLIAAHAQRLDQSSLGQAFCFLGRAAQGRQGLIARDTFQGRTGREGKLLIGEHSFQCRYFRRRADQAKLPADELLAIRRRRTSQYGRIFRSQGLSQRFVGRAKRQSLDDEQAGSIVAERILSHILK